ncbi:MAG: 2-hydroxyacyl-CoA dehydratase, partial [Chloroflexi bacterium]|nr:2-hydroxyacyl-CoA dehydratase [Chloroflexota bacterium]
MKESGRMNGLAKVDEVFRDRGKRARELKAQQKPVIGYLCTFTPVEIMAAAGVMPFRMAGNMREPIAEAGRYLESIACPFTRSVLDLGLRGEYRFLDGFVMPHACDNIVKLYDLWGHN